MESRGVDNAQWLQLKELVAEHFGLSVPGGLDHLQRCVEAVRDGFGFSDDAACIESLLSTPLTAERAQALAAELTIGETYFFRELAALSAFVERIVPELLRARRSRVQRLRILSAGCCTGEEAYSLAIMLHQRWPELMNWDVRIIGTDLNASFLEQAKAGVYKAWSFRATPSELKQRYFSPTGDGRHRVVHEIRPLVRFEQLNLAQEGYPSAASDFYAMDVIFCRNVLMYFTAAQQRKVIARLHATLADDGWLIVSPSEASASLFTQFVPVYASGAILFQRQAPGAPCAGATPGPSSPASQAKSVAHRASRALPRSQIRGVVPAGCVDFARDHDVLTRAESLLAQASYKQAVALLLTQFAAQPLNERGLALLVRALANLGLLEEAEAWCNRWIASEKLNPLARYMRAVLLIELDRQAEARTALQHALYLDPRFELAHFALGNLALREGDKTRAVRSFENALEMLRKREPDEMLAESGGMCVRELVELIGAVMQEERVP